MEAGRLQLFEVGRRALARNLEAVPRMWMRWRLVLASRGYSLAGHEVEADRHQVFEAGTTYLASLLEAFPCE